MAADTPVGLYPDAHTGVYHDEVLQFLKNPYSGAGTQREARWRIASDSGMTTIVWDSGLRENDDREFGDDWCEVHLVLVDDGDAWGATGPTGRDGRAGLAQQTTYYWDVEVRNTSNEISSRSTAKSFTTGRKGTSSANWRATQ